MNKKTKFLLVSLCAVFLVAASVLGTLAFLTDDEQAVNTFTVGKVDITLDEADVDEYGKEISGADRVTENSYKLIPGHEYTKDPQIHVVKGSEEAYIRMLVTVTNYANVKDAFDQDGVNVSNNILLLQNFVNWDNTNWQFVKAVPSVAGADDMVYEFRYNSIVDARNADVDVPKLFTKITMPGNLTEADLGELLDINGNSESFNITVVGHAIQADGFADADEAWAAFDAQVK